MNFSSAPLNITRERAIARLVGKLRHELLARVDEALVPLDLTAAQWSVVVHLAEASAHTPVELARIMDYDPGAMTRLLFRLEKKGIVRRVRSDEDRRSVGLVLTPKAQALVPEIMPLVMSVMDLMLNGFEDADRDRFRTYLERALANVKRPLSCPSPQASSAAHTD